VNKIEKQVLSLIGENTTNPDVFKDNDVDLKPIRDSINDAIQEINIINGGYTETFTLPLVANKTWYRIKFNRGFLGWVKDVWLVGQKRRLTQTSLTSLNNFDPRWFVHAGPPEKYVPVGLDVIGLYRKPSATSDVIEVTCNVIPDFYQTDKERIKVRDTFQWALVNYAVSEYWASRGDANEADKHMQIYLDNIGVKSAFNLYSAKKQLTNNKSQTA
jgi:hypothetical protein